MDLSFITNNLNTISVVLFYSTIMLLVYLNRKKFEIQSGFMAMKRTKLGLRLIDRVGKKHKELIKILGYIGIGVGFIGMIFVSYLMLSNLYTLLTVPGAQSQVAPAIPGVRIPGSPIYIPLITGWIALFIVVLVHEFSHGIVATANGLKIKSSGIVFFGPILGAFVEPNEKKLVKSHAVVQYSVFAAGPFSNILLSIAAFLLILFVMAPVINSITQPVGFSFEGVEKGLPASAAGVKPNMVFVRVNGIAVENDSLFSEVMQNSLPNEQLLLETKDQRFTLTTTSRPDNTQKGYVGVSGIKTEYTAKDSLKAIGFLYPVFSKLTELLWLILMLSSGIGIINLLPLGPIDGGRMLQTAMVSVGGKKKGLKLWSGVSYLFLIVLLLNIFLPLAMTLVKYLQSIF
jgi:membrane-associated protease RseP (regulator of RpoE activity)